MKVKWYWTANTEDVKMVSLINTLTNPLTEMVACIYWVSLRDGSEVWAYQLLEPDKEAITVFYGDKELITYVAMLGVVGLAQAQRVLA